MTASHPYDDSCISDSQAYAIRVWDWLRPRLETAELRVCLDRRDVGIGVPRRAHDEMLRTVMGHSRLRPLRQRAA